MTAGNPSPAADGIAVAASAPKPKGGGHVGIVVKHRARCASHDGGRCACRPAHMAHVWSAEESRRIRKTFTTLGDAKAWRTEMLVGLRRGTVRAPTKTTVRHAAEAWLAGVRDGTIVNRRRQPYKPSAIRSYERALRLRVLPELGYLRLSSVERRDVQDLADRLAGAGLDASTIRNTLSPLAAIYRRAMTRGDVAVNPTTGLELAAPAGRRDRIAAPTEAA